MKYTALRRSSAPLPDYAWNFFPDVIRRVYERSEIGRHQGEYDTVIEFEHDVPGANGPDYIGLGTVMVADLGATVGFCRGDVIEVNGIKVAVTALDVVKERRDDGKLITFWSVVIDEVQGGSNEDAGRNTV